MPIVYWLRRLGFIVENPERHQGKDEKCGKQQRV